MSWVRVPPPAYLPRRASPEAPTLPVRGELAALIHHYKHLHNELKHEKPEESTRRELEDKLLNVHFGLIPRGKRGLVAH